MEKWNPKRIVKPLISEKTRVEKLADKMRMSK